mmetsp:Transcript_4139/g.5626  ORF Transcript_4139/g.5626 Transcript_4139/m.5626 type:complete len:96 (+) Transcript_4139:154-441(+)
MKCLFVNERVIHRYIEANTVSSSCTDNSSDNQKTIQTWVLSRLNQRRDRERKKESTEVIFIGNGIILDYDKIFEYSYRCEGVCMAHFPRCTPIID